MRKEITRAKRRRKSVHKRCEVDEVQEEWKCDEMIMIQCLHIATFKKEK